MNEVFGVLMWLCVLALVIMIVQQTICNVALTRQSNKRNDKEDWGLK